MRAHKIKRRRQAARAIVSARVSDHVTLQICTNGQIIASSEGFSVDLGTFSSGAAKFAQGLHTGLPVASFKSSRRNFDKEIHLLIRQLAGHGLLEYRLARSRNDENQIVIEPQVSNYWPRTPRVGNADVLVLSRFAYMRRRGNAMVLESPLAPALFKICNPKIAASIAALCMPQQIKMFRRQEVFPGTELLALLVDCQILFKIDAISDESLRTAEGDENLILWDFHDLLFHTRSTVGRHTNPLGGLYPYTGVVPSLPAVRPRWPGRRIDLRKFSAADSETISPIVKLLRERHSTRVFDNKNPITIGEISRFLDKTARVLSRRSARIDCDDGGLSVEYTVRPYPSAGASYELELYLTVDKCEGLTRGFYHYDAAGHVLVPIVAPTHELEMSLTGAKFAMDAPDAPQILITIAARFARVTWKYSSLAYELILKDVGVLTQTLYLVAADMGLGGCAIGSANVDLFAKMTGIEFHVEGPVGQFALGRGATFAFGRGGR